MGLNNFRDEAYSFLEKIGAKDESFNKLMGMLDEEVELLKESERDMDSLRHQICDVLFILFEISGKHNLDLDAEWDKGRKRKQKKYIDKE